MATRLRLVLIALLAVLAGCVQNDGSTLNPLKKLTQVTRSDERHMGAKADAYFRSQLKLIDDPVVLGYLNAMGQDMVGRVDHPDFSYRFRLVIDKSLNAFALPAGYIYLHTGTVMAAGSPDELAGVMAHEIAHVERSHMAQMAEKSAIPTLLAQILGIGASVASGSPVPMIAAQGVSQGLQLSYSREFEAEADQVGTAFMVRAGYDPMGMARFFDRLLAEKKPGQPLPAYLLSHPRVESRLDEAVQRARRTTIAGKPNLALRAGFHEMQLRLALLLDEGRTTLVPKLAPPDRAVVRQALDTADQQAKGGDVAAALATLEAAERAQPTAPEIPFRRGELLAREDRQREAVAAFGTAIRLAPETALTYYRQGQAYRALGDVPHAIFAFEQAEHRFEPGRALQKAASRALFQLTFPVVAEAGFADGDRDRDADTPGGHGRTRFAADAGRVVFWARVQPEWVDRREQIRLRWLDPSGKLVEETKAESARRPFVVSELRLPDDAASRLGVWHVEGLMAHEPIARWTFRLTAAGDAQPGSDGSARR